MAFNNIYQGKKVLVTGNTGFKGSWLSTWLTMLGADVYGFSNKIPTNPSMFDVLKLAEKTHHVFGDIRGKELFNEYVPVSMLFLNVGIFFPVKSTVMLSPFSSEIKNVV